MEVLQWLTDLDEGEFIETTYWKRDYLCFPNVTQCMLDQICRVVNTILEIEKSRTRVYNSMGEIKRSKIKRKMR
jgi:hypothetical protein